MLDSGRKFVIKRSGLTIAEVSLTDMIDSLLKNGQGIAADPEDLIVDFSNDKISLSLQFGNLSGQMQEGQFNVDSFDARLLFSLLEG